MSNCLGLLGYLLVLKPQPPNKEAWEMEIYQLGPQTIHLSICGAELLWDTRKSLQQRTLNNVFWCSGYDIIVVCLIASDVKKKPWNQIWLRFALKEKKELHVYLPFKLSKWILDPVWTCIKKDLGLVVWIRQKGENHNPFPDMCPHSYTPRQQQCFVKVTRAKNKMWCLSPKELCKLKEANQKLLVPPSKSKTYSAVVLLPSAPVNRLICHICHYPISSVWLRQTPLTAAKTPHSHACLHTVKHAFSK